jgi:hypothetical protein
MNNDSIKILCCYYLNNSFLPSNSIYLPIQCGKESTKLDLKILGDDTGDNISNKNRYWSEITGLYWAWRNLSKVNYIGLCSYRRFFNYKKNPLSLVKILPSSSYKAIDEIKIPNIQRLLTKYDVIIPRPYIYAYSLRNVCKMNYKGEDFDILEAVIHELFPDYDEVFYNLFYMNNRGLGHNMFIMSWDNFDRYCNWVFPILFEVERRINPTNYPINQVRVFGYMHEILLWVFIEKNKMNKYYSQITWVTDEMKTTSFNNIFYKISANLSFFFNKPRYFNGGFLAKLLFGGRIKKVL